MSSDSPLVSIIMPNYNGARFLAGTIESVLSQTYSNWELLLVDDGSTDSSKEIADKYAARDKRIKSLRTIFEKKARGPGAARNTAIDQAAGRYIAFLDSDDKWRPNKLEEQTKFMLSKQADFAFCWYDIIDEADKIVGTKRFKKELITYHDLLKDCPIGCLTAIYDTSRIGKQFIYLSPLDRFADYSLWLRILKVTRYAYCLHQPLAEYRLVSGSISANKIQAAQHQWDVLRKIEKLSFFQASYYFAWYALKGIFTKLRFLVIRRRLK